MEMLVTLADNTDMPYPIGNNNPFRYLYYSQLVFASTSFNSSCIAFQSKRQKNNFFSFSYSLIDIKYIEKSAESQKGVYSV